MLDQIKEPLTYIFGVGNPPKLKKAQLSDQYVPED